MIASSAAATITPVIAHKVVKAVVKTVRVAASVAGVARVATAVAKYVSPPPTAAKVQAKVTARASLHGMAKRFVRSTWKAVATAMMRALISTLNRLRPGNGFARSSAWNLRVRKTALPTHWIVLQSQVHARIGPSSGSHATVLRLRCLSVVRGASLPQVFIVALVQLLGRSTATVHRCQRGLTDVPDSLLAHWCAILLCWTGSPAWTGPRHIIRLAC